MNLLEKLLENDKAILMLDTKQFEVKRLSKLLGEPFILKLQEIPAKRYMEIQNMCVSFDTDGTTQTDIPRMQLLVVNEGIQNEEFRNREVLKKYHAGTPIDLLEKIFNAGELSKIFATVSELCGFDEKKQKKQIDIVKN